MTAEQVISEIESLSPDEQAKVVRFAYQLDAGRQLTGEELSALAQRMVDSSDPVQKALIRDAIIRGFYGEKPNA
jgi:hypothetical protein